MSQSQYSSFGSGMDLSTFGHHHGVATPIRQAPSPLSARYREDFFTGGNQPSSTTTQSGVIPATNSNANNVNMVNTSVKMPMTNGHYTDSSITTGYSTQANGYTNGDTNGATPSSAFSSKFNGSVKKEPVPLPSATNGDSKCTNGRGFSVPKRDYSAAPNSRDIVGYVGFANIPNQVFRRAIKQGFDFTLLVVGQSGLGKSTFINSLFLTDMYGDSNRPGESKTVPKTVQIKEQCVRLVEDGVQLNLTLVDTPGFGDSIDNSKCWDPIIQFVDRKYSDFFTEETKIARPDRIPDKRVHCCLYFIAPGHGLKPLDIEYMKQLHERTNIVPIIAKADTMTPEELARFKRAVVKELAENKIKVYNFPDSTDEEEQKELVSMKDRVPFAIIGSNLVKEVDGRKVRCRIYPWGTVEVENMAHNDFIALRNMLIRTYLIDLIDVTSCVHYENFRVRQMMSKAGVNAGPDVVSAIGDKDPFTALEHERNKHEREMDAKKREMERVLHEKSADRERAIANKEKEYLQQIADLQAKVATKKADFETQSAHLGELKKQYPQLAPTDASRASLRSGYSDETSPESAAKKKGKTLGMFSRHRD